LQLIHRGQTQTQSEQSLHITKRTIKNHINRILKNMGVKTSKEAVCPTRHYDQVPKKVGTFITPPTLYNESYLQRHYSL